MPDIFHRFPIRADAARVYAAISTGEGLATWWTWRSSGQASSGTSFELDFGPGYRWQAQVLRAIEDSEFELELTAADGDWTGTVVAFRLIGDGDGTVVEFQHRGWAEANDHYRTSCFCWAMYLRLLRCYLEHGDVVPYADRLDA